MQFIISRYTLRKNDLPLTTFLQPGGTFGPKETAQRYVTVTAASRVIDETNVGEDSLIAVPVMK